MKAKMEAAAGARAGAEAPGGAGATARAGAGAGARLPENQLRVLGWLRGGRRSYDELLAQYTSAFPANGGDTREAFAVLIGAMVGEGLLERDVAPDGAPGVATISGLWLSEKGKRLVE